MLAAACEMRPAATECPETYLYRAALKQDPNKCEKCLAKKEDDEAPGASIITFAYRPKQNKSS